MLLLDITQRPDIVEFIRIHQYSEPGDVNLQWGQIEGHEGTTALFLRFVRRMEMFMVLEFDIVKKGFLVEQALTGQGVYLAKAEGENDRLIKDIVRGKVLVEIPDTGFDKVWDDMFHKVLAKHFRSNGLGRSESERAARSYIGELRKMRSLRMRDVLPVPHPS